MPRNAVRVVSLLVLVSLVGLALLPGLGAADATAASDRGQDRGTACDTPDDAMEIVPERAVVASEKGVTTAFVNVGCIQP